MKTIRSIVVLGMCTLVGCEARVIVDQPKPLEVNVNLSGHVDIVIHDARQDLEQITGEKPTQVVKPEDIGLPAAPAGKASSAADNPGSLGGGLMEERMVPVLFVRGRTGAVERGETGLYAVATTDDLKKAMAARNAQVRAMWDSGVVGEAHGGLLEERGTLSAEQKTLMAAENADRSALYAAEAKEKKATVEEVALGYYVARLGYAKPKAWYEKYNQTTKKWEWQQWAGK